MNMDYLTGFLCIGGICLLVLCIVYFKKGINLLINFATRALVGMVSIYLINQGLVAIGMGSLYVGFNYITALTCGTLGLPGLALLYGVMVFKNL